MNIANITFPVLTGFALLWTMTASASTTSFTIEHVFNIGSVSDDAEKWQLESAALWRKGRSGNREFDDLDGIAIDRATRLIYAADSGNHRIQVFRRSRLPSQ